MPIAMAETWLVARRESRDGKMCRVIEVLDEDRSPRLAAVAFPWRRGIEVADRRGRRAFAIVRRRLFAFTGRFDVIDADGRSLGTLTRRGQVRDASGVTVGRFRDERRIRHRAGLSAMEALVNAAAGLEGTSAPHGPTSYVWIVEGRLAGALRRTRRTPTPGSPAVRGAGEPARAGPVRWLRKMAAALGRPEAPPTWRFAREPHTGVDARLIDAAAICAIELSYW